MFNTSEVVLRNRSRLSGTLLVLGPPQDGLLSDLGVRGMALTEHFGASRTLPRPGGTEVVFGCELVDPEARFDQVLVFMPKAKQELAMRLALATSVVVPGGSVFLVGEKREGIAGGARLLEAFGDTVKLDMARHCQFWSLRPSALGKPFQLSDWLQRFDVTVAETTLSVAALPGVFSEGRLDEGTRCLLETFDAAPGKRILDFACGAGIVGGWLAKRFGNLAVDYVDVQAQALACTRQTLAWNGLEGQVWPSDGLSGVSGRYDAIVTNPPFHSGVKTDLSATEGFLRDAARHLVPGGELRLVANAFLPYRSLIEAQIGPVDVLSENRRFIVYRARTSR